MQMERPRVADARGVSTVLVVHDGDDLALLRLEAETIWGCDDRGRLMSGVIVATGTTYDGTWATWPGTVTLDPDTEVEVAAARSWVLGEQPVGSAPQGLRLVTTEGPFLHPAQWYDDEWDDLLTGRRGPWAALVEGDQVVSLAHSARLTSEAAEVGVQTEESHRGRGLGGIVVGAWARQLSPRLTLFYSALESNAASQRVAEKLVARPIGRLVHLAIPGED